MTKEELINELLHDPLNFERMNMMDDLIKSGLTFDDIRECIRKIYDLSESQLRETSNANKGMMGKLNRRSTSQRMKRFNRRIKKLKEGDNYKIIYTEGDSWFQFPVFIKDIIDWLNDNKNYIIYSDAYGGDWITNIIYESQYVSALSVLRPDFFLISGGGNDLVGNNRLAIMVRQNNKPGSYYPKYPPDNPINDPDLSAKHIKMIMDAQQYITKEFYAFLLVIKAQYLKLFRDLYDSGSTQKEVITITQGYDYAIPGLKPDWPLFHPVQVLINKIAGNGCWLKRPLKIRGIFDEEIQKAIVMTFIYEFNQVFISLTTQYGFDNVYHVDCRDLAFFNKCWFDELHYKSHVYKISARAYSHIIDNRGNCEKVIKASDFREKKFSSGKDSQLYLQNQAGPMYYLVIKNLNNEKCIDKNKNDIYTSGGSFSCLKTMAFNKTNFVRKIKIRCKEDPSYPIDAIVYSD